VLASASDINASAQSTAAKWTVLHADARQDFPVTHNGQASSRIFLLHSKPCAITRWWSTTIPAELEIVAQTSEGEIMALKHKQHPTYGVQFHPESILTEHGKQLLRISRYQDRSACWYACGTVHVETFIAKTINRTD